MLVWVKMQKLSKVNDEDAALVELYGEVYGANDHKDYGDGYSDDEATCAKCGQSFRLYPNTE
jgi:hypothetical protein